MRYCGRKPDLLHSRFLLIDPCPSDLGGESHEHFERPADLVGGSVFFTVGPSQVRRGARRDPPNGLESDACGAVRGVSFQAYLDEAIKPGDEVPED